MKSNEGSIDRVLRFVIGAVLIAVSFMFPKIIQGNLWGIIACVAGVIALGTSFIGFCPLYKMLGLSTCSACRVD